MVEVETTTSKRVRLTDRYIMNLKATDRRVAYWDDVESGLAVQVTPTGHKSFIVVRRIRNGGPKKVVLRPPYPTLSLAQARSKAVEVKIMLANGIDPLAKQRQEDAEREKANETRFTFAAVAEKFIAKKLVGLRSAKLIEQVIRRDILSRPWSKKSISAVSKADVLSMFHDIRTDKDRSTPGQWSTPAIRVYNYVARILAWALTKDEFGLEVNVADKIDIAEEMNAPKRTARERTLSDLEFAAFWRACTAEGYPGGDMLKLLALSCCRLREIAHAEWPELSVIDGVENISGPVLVIPSRRMKGLDGKIDPHTVPVTPLMQSILDSLPRFATPKYIFTRSGRALNGFGQLKDRIDRRMREELPDLEHWSFHDLRRTGRSNLSRLGVSADTAERCLAHKLGGVRGIYDKHSFLGEKRDALTKLSGLYSRIINPEPNVLEFKPVLTAS